jgi:hypothetical protein
MGARKPRDRGRLLFFVRPEVLVVVYFMLDRPLCEIKSMNPISLLYRMPPISVLIGAVFAFASYLTTNVWKANNDDKIMSYQAIIDRASFFEVQSSSLPRFQAASAYSFQLYLLSQEQLGAVYDASAAFGHQIGVSQYSLDRTPQDARAISRETGLLENFFDMLPNGVANQPIIQGSPLFKYGASASWFLPECISNLYMSDSTVGRSLKQKYDAEFASLYQKRSTDNKETDDYPATVSAAGAALKMKLQVQELATADIAKLQLPAINPLPPPPEAFEDGIAEGTPQAQAIFADHRSRAVTCIDNARDEVLDHYFYLLMETRRVVSEQLIGPLTDSNRNIERLEIGLYILSAIVALIAAAPARPDKSSET